MTRTIFTSQIRPTPVVSMIATVAATSKKGLSNVTLEYIQQKINSTPNRKPFSKIYIIANTRLLFHTFFALKLCEWITL